MPKKVTKTPKKVTDKKPELIPYYTLSLRFSFATERSAKEAQEKILELMEKEFGLRKEGKK